MSPMPIAPASDQVKIAIALYALRLKPEKQSLASYVVELRGLFPCRDVLASSSPVGEAQWRERALALEAELAKTRAACENDRASLLASLNLHRDLPFDPSDSSSATDLTTSKKKRKRTAHPNSISPVDLDTVLRGIDTGHTIPPITGQFSILASFQALKNLAVLSEDGSNAHTLPLLTRAATCAIDNLALFMGNIDSGQHPSVEVLHTTSTLVSYLITVTLPLLTSGVGARRVRSSPEGPSMIDAVDDILGHLTTLILVPLTRSYASITRSLLENVFLSKHAAKSEDAVASDVRPTVCCLLRKALSDLDHLCPLAANSLVSVIAGVRARVALEAVREIEIMYPHRPSPAVNVDRLRTSDATTPIPPSQPDLSGSSTDRIAALARKDVTWYMCSLLHWHFSSLSISVPAIQAAARQHIQSDVLRGAILTGLSNLCQSTTTARPPCAEMKNACLVENGILSERCHRPAPIDEVSQGMIFAVVEHAWFYYFCSGTGVEDVQP
ncbi:hypothetical protein FIBSPDRAFT_1054224 [Athelia psychrophila]|uniref:Uncharacterized protein n=1 Tax=Athelia psychrophila TaxID=1759441 RepID=A0A167VNJ1_9AGAM|nr:hypothetical protein FIBSPDRAFT_1054224 [Fibularhizoctonia sp. CBS 109695]